MRRAQSLLFGSVLRAFLGTAPGCTSHVAEFEAPSRRSVTILHVADVHSHLFPRSVSIDSRDAALGLGPEGESVSVGGAARLAALLDRERARSEASFFFDAGDLLEGTSVYSVFHGVPEVSTFERLEVDAAAVGNHDLSRGASALSALRNGRASFPILAANLEDLISSGLAAPFAVLEKGGVRVLAIGLGRTPDGPVNLADCASAVRRAVAEQGASVDLVVVLSHLGRDLDLALVPRTSGIDVVLGGHTHDVLDPPAIVMDCGPDLRARMGCASRPVMVAHPGAYGRYLGRIDVVVSSDPADRAVRGAGRSAVVESQAALLPVNAALPERPDISEMLEPYADALARAGFGRAFAFAPGSISRQKAHGGDSALGNFVARAMRVSARADLAVVNATGVRADLPKGDLSPDDFFEVLPFDDSLVTLDVSGADLESAFSDVARASCARNRVSQAEIDGGAVVLSCNPARAALSVDGRPLAPGATYRVAAVSFLTDEPGQWLSGRGRRLADGPPVRDVAMAAARSAERCAAAPADLPCVDGRVGAEADGRISWE